jgi:hypothetical protein
MAARAQREEKSIFVARLEEVLPLLRERFGVTKNGIFGSTARGDVDVLVELSPDRLMFRNFSALADLLEELYGRKEERSLQGRVSPASRWHGPILMLRFSGGEIAYLTQTTRHL